ncbi:hypothetical protein ACX801_21065 [Arthrobacter bambusae]
MTGASSRKYTDAEERKIFAYQREGYEAYLTGLSARNIPYKYGDPGNEPWIRGYNQARTDRVIENRKVTP